QSNFRFLPTQLIFPSSFHVLQSETSYSHFLKSSQHFALSSLPCNRQSKIHLRALCLHSHLSKYKEENQFLLLFLPLQIVTSFFDPTHHKVLSVICSFLLLF